MQPSMTPEQCHALQAAGPNLYRKGFHFENPAGWYELVLQLTKDLEQQIASEPPRLPRHFRARQVKSKFATLRFLMFHETHAMSAFIVAAEHRSTTLCETCGLAGTLCVTATGWLYVACPEHVEAGSRVTTHEAWTHRVGGGA